MHFDSPPAGEDVEPDPTDSSASVPERNPERGVLPEEAATGEGPLDYLRRISACFPCGPSVGFWRGS